MITKQNILDTVSKIDAAFGAEDYARIYMNNNLIELLSGKNSDASPPIVSMFRTATAMGQAIALYCGDKLKSISVREIVESIEKEDTFDEERNSDIVSIVSPILEAALDSSTVSIYELLEVAFKYVTAFEYLYRFDKDMESLEATETAPEDFDLSEDDNLFFTSLFGDK